MGAHVADWRSFLFYRYELLIDDEVLDAKTQLVALKEMQGNYVPHSAKGAKEGLFDSVLMRPRSFTMDDGNLAITFSVGQAIGARVRVTYDKRNEEIDRKQLADDSLRYADFVAVPKFGVFAVSDRSGDEYMPGSTAAHRFRSIFRWQSDVDADAVVTAAADYKDVQRALKKWTVSTFSFTIRPSNPHPPGVEAKALEDELKARNVARSRGTWEADDGKSIKPDDEMKGIIDLTEAGYGQIAIKGSTDEGVQAEIRKLPFSEDKGKNLNSLDQPREMRVKIDAEGLSDTALKKRIAAILVEFYGN
jgi:hypothetical protein